MFLTFHSPRELPVSYRTKHAWKVFLCCGSCKMILQYPYMQDHFRFKKPEKTDQKMGFQGLKISRLMGEIADWKR